MQGLKRCKWCAYNGSKILWFEGVLWCMQGSKCCNFQGLNILQFPGFSACKSSNAGAQSASISRILRGFVHARLHIQQFPGTLCMQELDVLHFPELCAKGLQMLLEVLHFPRILCTPGFHMLQLLFWKLPENWAPEKTQNDNWICKKSSKTTINIVSKNPLKNQTSQLQFPGILRDASITESKCFNCQRFKCAKFQKFCVHHWSTCRLYRLGSKNGHSGQILIQTWATRPLLSMQPAYFLQSIFRERTNIEYV